MRRWLLLIATVLLLVPCARASAQEEAPLGEFSVQRFTPAPGPDNYFGVDGAEVTGHLSPSARLMVDYAHEPFVVVRCPSETDCDFDDREAELVSSLLTANLMGSFTLVDRVQIGLVLPLAYSSGDGFAFGGTDGEGIIESHSSFGLGDPELSAKVKLWDQGKQGLDLAAAVQLTAPLGQLTADDAYIGDGNVTAGGHVIVGYAIEDFHASGNVGGVWREEETLFSTEIGPEITYGVGVGYDVTPLLTVLGELQGSAGLSDQVDENPLEGRVGARLRHGDFVVSAAIGAGLVSGAGTPLVRALVGGGWVPKRTDEDGDGLLDADDACPSEAEDMDGFQDGDGCPEPDNDEDGLLDGEDRCPDEAEDRDGYEDEDGCPDTDNDGDGITDGFDSCPDKPEDMDGDRDEDGCPDGDTDRDGIDDAEDQCPEQPEDTDGFGDLDGCPEEDFDLDGIPDVEDTCPDEPEVYDGYEDDDGCPEDDADGDGYADAIDQCPEQPETLNGFKDDDGCPDAEVEVRLEDDRIVLTEQPEMRETRIMPRGKRLLTGVATLLQRHRHLRSIRVEAPAEGQAQAVVDYLAAQGIEQGRLRAVAAGGEAEGIAFHVEPTTPGAEAAAASTEAAEGADAEAAEGADAAE